WSGRVRPSRYGSGMGKVKRLFVCSSCERPSGQWSGKCSWCGSWGTVAEQPAGMAGSAGGARAAPAERLRLGQERAEARIHTCLVASGEEARAQVAARARRLGLAAEAVGYLPGRDLGHVVAAATAERPAVLIVDSIQTIRDPDSEAVVGGVGQVRACADALI